jgi:hypothetical protein
LCTLFTPGAPDGLIADVDTVWAVFLAALFANYFLGAFAPVFFLAVYFVRAILLFKAFLKMLFICSFDFLLKLILEVKGVQI